MPKTQLTVSIVIPAYNEERHLRACLQAIARQSVKPLEVIVVDNNSTDATTAIARSFPFVTLLSEPRQGVVYARDRGFNAARGDVIGRIDGDSLIAPDWVARVRRLFADSNVQALSGQVDYREVGWQQAFTAIDGRIRRHLAKRMGAARELFLYGVNMAIRREAWQLVRTDVCHDRNLHEDIDLAAHMALAGQKVAFSPDVRAAIVPRQAAASPREFYRYVWASPRAYANHDLTSQRYMYPVALFVLGLYLPIRVMYRGYNPATQRFSLGYAFRGTAPIARPSPVSESI